MRSLVSRGRHLLTAAGRSIIPVGAHFVPSGGPDWPWRVGADAFDAAFAAMAAAGLDTVRIDLLWSAIEPRPGEFDEAHLAVLDAILAAARRHDLWLHPTLFIGGEVGDAFWDVPWRAGRQPHADPEMRRLEAAHAAMLGRRWRGDPALIAWDLTDEPPFWPFADTTAEDARGWTTNLRRAMADADPMHLVTLGTSGQETGWGPFRADVVAEHLDFGAVHPYPIYQPELYPDSLLSPRMTHAGAFEVALASGAGRPVMLHEYGASSAQFDPELVAAYDRLLAWSSLGRGAIGFYAWCWTDAAPEAARRAPYVRQPHEMQFGLTDWSGRPRPRGHVLSELAASMGHLDLDAAAADGPRADGAVVVPHEYAAPYDPAAFGLNDGRAGEYRPAEAATRVPRSVLPLMRGLLNAFVMAARAGVSLEFPRERLDDAWPAARLVLLPAPLASTTSTLLHVRTSWWRGAADHFARGGSLYLSCSADVAIPDMLTLVGCRIVDRVSLERPPVLRFVRRWGPFRPTDELVLPPWPGDLETRGVRLAVGDGEAIALDGEGNPALVAARRGAGHAVTCAFPIEALLARVPDAHGPADRTWGLYAGLADRAGLDRTVVSASPEVTVGRLAGPAGGTAALTNHGPTTTRVVVGLPPLAASPAAVDASGVSALAREGDTVEIALPAYGSGLVTWRTPDSRGSRA